MSCGEVLAYADTTGKRRAWLDEHDARISVVTRTWDGVCVLGLAWKIDRVEYEVCAEVRDDDTLGRMIDRAMQQTAIARERAVCG